MSGRSGLQETGEELDRKSVAATLFSSQGKEIETQTFVHSLKDGENPQGSLKGKLTWPSEERENGSEKLYEAEVEAGNCE